MVNNVFHSVAQNYDIMNDVLSLGIHRCWKTSFVDDIGAIRPVKTFNDDGTVKESAPKVLDVAGGTGDIAFKIIQQNQMQMQSYYSSPRVNVTVLDINSSMLQVGYDRSIQQGINQQQISFVEGNAEELNQFADNTFDLYTIAFGIRNVPRIEKALAEAYRVLKPGGRFMCLEFSKVNNAPFEQVYKFYNANILPVAGGLIANDPESYRYLAESIDKFHDQETFLKLIENAGFKYCSYKDLTMGICAIHSGFKI